MWQGSGYTLTEMIIVIVVAGLVAGVALPGLRGIIQSNRVTTTHNELVSTLWHARSEAIGRGQPVMVCNGQPSKGCDHDNGWEAGWYTAAVPAGTHSCRDRDRDGYCDSHGGRVIHQNNSVPDGISVTGNGRLLNSRVKFQPSGMARGYAGTLTICDTTPRNVNGSGIVINVSGRLRRAESGDLSC